MLRAVILGMALAMTCGVSAASCADSGKAVETVELSIGGARIERWETLHGKIHQVRLPSGYQLGVRIDPTTREKYEELLTKMRGIDELVKITLFDMNGAQPVQVSESWGGTNSTQGVRAIGGAKAIPAASDQFRLWLHKPVCVTRESLSAMHK